MKTVTITILSINPDGTLNLSDGGTSDVSIGDTVQWEIGPNSGVASITGIEDNVDLDIFYPDPALDPGSSQWSGVVRTGLTLPCEETYTIHYTTTSTNEVHRYDPKIQVDS